MKLENKKKDFCIILTKSTAEIDYLFPLIDHNYKEFDIFTLSYSKEEIIPNNSLLKQYLDKRKINVYDLKNFIQKKNFIINFIANLIIENELQKKELFIKLIKNFSLELTNIFFKNILSSISKRIFHLVFNLIKKKNILNNYKYLFVGHRNFQNNFIKKIFKSFILNNNKFVLIPHGPHYEELFPSNLSEVEMEIMNKKKLNIVSNQMEKPWLSKFYRREECKIFDYPLFFYDFNKLKKYKFYKNIKLDKTKKKILIISRTFSISKKITNKKGEFITNEEKFYNFISKLKTLDKNNFQFLIKPHPSTNIQLLKLILNKINLNNLYVIQDPILFYLNEVDYVYSYNSSAMILPIFLKKPLIYFKDNYSSKYFDWEIINKIYKCVTFSMNENGNLSNLIEKANKKETNIILNKKNKKIKNFFKKRKAEDFFKIIREL